MRMLSRYSCFQTCIKLKKLNDTVIFHRFIELVSYVEEIF